MNSIVPPDPAASRRAYQRELFSNQVWQGVNFLSKAGFLFLLTPLMIAKWGTEGYGLFALASSLLVSMALIDGGVRALTRIRLAEAIRVGSERTYQEAYWRGLSAFGMVAVLVFLGVTALGSSGVLAHVLKLPVGGSLVMVVTVGLTGLFMFCTLALEPIAAAGNLSVYKAANTVAALLAIPVCAGALFLNAGVLVVVVLYSLCFIISCLVLGWKEKVHAIPRPAEFSLFDLAAGFRTLKAGGWFYMTTVALVLKTHGLTFVVAAMAGPAEAGIFYVLLRLSEIIGTVGSTASETSLASLASSGSPAEKGARFRQSWLYVAVFSLYGAIGLIFLGHDLLAIWLAKDYVLAEGIFLAMAVFGLTGAYSRVVVNASMGLGVVKSAAWANLTEAVASSLLAAVGYRIGGLPGLFVGGSAGVIFLASPAQMIARLCASGFWKTYVSPLGLLLPRLVAASVILAWAGGSRSLWAWLMAGAVAGALALWELRHLHARNERSPH